MAGYIPRWFTCPQAVTHSSTIPVHHRATSLIEHNVLLLCHQSHVLLS